MIKYMTRRAILNKGMILAAGIPIFMFYYELFVGQNLLYIIEQSGIYWNGLTLVSEVFALSVYIIFAGMFPGIPYGFSLLEERNSGYLRFILQRMSAKRYIQSKIFWVGISGAVSTFIPYLALAVPVWMLTVDSGVEPYQNLAFVLQWQQIALTYGEGMVYLLKGLLMVLFGILWAEVTLLLSLFVKNKYIAFVLPFVLFQLIWILIPNHDLNPVFLIRSDSTVDEWSLGWSFILFILYTVLVIIGIYFVFRRQVRNEKI